MVTEVIVYRTPLEYMLWNSEAVWLLPMFILSFLVFFGIFSWISEKIRPAVGRNKPWSGYSSKVQYSIVALSFVASAGVCIWAL